MMLRQLLLSLIFIATANGLFAQAPAIEWQKSYGGTDSEIAYYVIQTSDNGYLVTGYTQSTDGDVTNNQGLQNCWLLKLDASGNIKWKKTYGGSNSDNGIALRETADGNYLMGCSASSNDKDVSGNHGKWDYWLVKLDTGGNILWQKTYGGSGSEGLMGMELTRDKGCVLVGYSNSKNGDVTGNHGDSDYWVVKVDSAGNLQWQKSLGGGGSDIGYTAVQTADGGYVVGGQAASINGDLTFNHGSYDFWLVKLDSTGNLEWQKPYGGSDHDGLHGLQAAHGGGFIMAGHERSTDGDVTGNHGDYDYWLARVDNGGNLVWQKAFGGTNAETANSVVLTPDGGYMVSGWARSSDGDVTGNHGFYDFWLIKTDSGGVAQWKKTFGGSGLEYPRSIQLTKDWGYVLTGESNSSNGDATTNKGSYDYWIVKLEGSLIFDNTLTPGVKAQATVYPNPADAKVQWMTAGGNINTIQIFDLSGKIIYNELVNASAGELEVAAIERGMYFIQFSSARGIYTRKLVLE